MRRPITRRPVPSRQNDRPHDPQDARRNAPHAPHAPHAHAVRDAAFALQTLEPRLALSAVVSAQGLLEIVGRNGVDRMELSPGPNPGEVVLTGVAGVERGTILTGVDRILVNLRAGGDRFTLTADILNTQGAPAPITVLGGSGADTITVNTTAARADLRGNNGRDTLTSGGGDDKLSGGTGGDTLSAGAGNDRLDGKQGPDILIGGPGNDVLIGGSGPDELWGNDGDDTLRGGGAGDLLFGGRGVDRVLGNAGPDKVNAAPDEARDFAPGDSSFDDLFDPASQGVLPGHQFWEYLAPGETDGRLSENLQRAVRVVVDSFSRATPEYRELAAVCMGLSDGERDDLHQALRVETDEFVDVFYRGPVGLVGGDIESLLARLNTAAIGSPVHDSLVAWNARMFDWLQVTPGSLVSAVTRLPAYAPGTQGLLLGFGSVLNLANLLESSGG